MKHLFRTTHSSFWSKVVFLKGPPQDDDDGDYLYILMVVGQVQVGVKLREEHQRTAKMQIETLPCINLSKRSSGSGDFSIDVPTDESAREQRTPPRRRE